MNNSDADTRAHALPAPDKPGLWWYKRTSEPRWVCLYVHYESPMIWRIAEVFPNSVNHGRFHKDQMRTANPGHWVFVAPPSLSAE